MRKGLQNSIQHLNQLAYSARAYRSFHCDSMKQQGVLQLPPWMGCKSIPRLPPAFHQASLTDSYYPFVLMMERELL